jgi:hypothetical protein
MVVDPTNLIAGKSMLAEGALLLVATGAAVSTVATMATPRVRVSNASGSTKLSPTQGGHKTRRN